MFLYGRTNKGRIRDTNQDGMYLAGTASNGPDQVATVKVSVPQLIYVADGVGGTQDGAFAVRLMLSYSMRCPCPNSAKQLSEYLFSMNDDVCTSAALEHKETASTIAGVLALDTGCFAFNIGDSSVFSINNGFLQKLSTDDTVYGLTDSSPEDGATIKAPLLQYIGKQRLETDAHICQANTSVEFIICSDGLTDLVDIDELEGIIEKCGSPTEMVDLMLQAALEHGGDDNITIVYVRR